MKFFRAMCEAAEQRSVLVPVQVPGHYHLLTILLLPVVLLAVACFVRVVVVLAQVGLQLVMYQKVNQILKNV